MHFYQWAAGISLSLLLTSTPLSAKTVISTEQLQITQCLAANLSGNYPILAENRDFQIIDVPSVDIDGIAILADHMTCGRFMNVSEVISSHTKAIRKQRAQQLLLTATPKNTVQQTSPYAIRHPSEVITAINQVNSDAIMATLNQMTHFENRSATRKTGVDTANWLKASFDAMVSKSGREDTAAWFVKTGRHYKQPSLVTVIGKDIKAPAIVIGAHMDTLDGNMPGAGDDGSGSASIMEMARILLESPTPLDNPVYFIWYAAEERGLVGSQFVVRDFIKKAIPVKAAIQFDMTGFRNDSNDPTMWVYRDYTDNALSNFVEKLITTYIGVPVATSFCGYGCSDHASWMNAGIPAAFPCETDFEHHNSKIHTSDDTVARLTPEHMVNFTKLGLAFAIELARD